MDRHPSDYYSDYAWDVQLLQKIKYSSKGNTHIYIFTCKKAHGGIYSHMWYYFHKFGFFGKFSEKIISLR